MVRISSTRLDMEDGRIDQAVLRDYGETLVGGASGTNTGASYDIDLDDGNAFHLILTANCTFTFSNPTASGTAHSFTLILRQDTTGSRTVTWPGSVTWDADTEPTLTTTPTYADIFSFLTVDGGSTWYGFIGGQNYSRASVKGVIEGLGLTSGLKLALDAGDSSSYSTGQSWLDLSGNGYDFFRGATSSATTDDPTFNGTAGNRSSAEYWSFDGGDYFRYDTTNETWMNNLHKDNAQFTILAWVYMTSSASAVGVFGSMAGGSSNIGIALAKQTNDKLSFACANGSGSIARYKDTTSTMTFGTWTLIGITIDEAGGSSASFFTFDGQYAASSTNTWDASYTSPSASSATFTYDIAARGNGANKFLSTDRMATFCVWEGTTLSITDIANFYSATRNRFGV